MKVAIPHMGKYSEVIMKQLGDYLGWEVVMPPLPSDKTIELGSKYMQELMCLPAKVTLGTMIEACEMGAGHLLMFDSCLTDNNDVWTQRGLVKPSEVQLGDKLLSLNEDTREIEWTEVKRTFKRTAQEIIKIEMKTSSGIKTLEVTPEHPIYAKRNNQWQWIKASELIIGDILYTSGSWSKKVIMTGDSNPYRKYPHLRKKQSEYLRRNNPLFDPITKAKHDESMKYAGPQISTTMKERGINVGDKNGLRKHPEKNPMRNPLARAKLSATLKTLPSAVLKHYTREEWGKKMSAALRNNPERLKKFQEAGVRGIMKKPELLVRLSEIGRSAARKLCPNHQEQAYIDSDLPIRYVGNRQIEIGGFFPDFLVEGQRKLVEVHHPIWCQIRGETWQEYCDRRRLAYNKEGYQVLFVNGAISVREGKKLISDFINNGRKVIKIERCSKNILVYNYSCLPNNNYYVNGILTHNCGTCRLKTYWILQERALKKLGYNVKVHPMRLGKGTPSDIRAVDPSIPFWKAWWAFIKVLQEVYRIDKQMWVEVPDESRMVKIGIVGEIFSILEPAINKNLIQKVEKMGALVHNSLPLSYFIFKGFYNRGWMKRRGVDRQTFLVARRKAHEYFPKEIGGHGIESIVHSIYYGMKNFDGVIHVEPFACMPESTVAAIIDDIGHDYNIPVMRLIFDAHTGETGLNTRLEAFVDILQRKKQRRK